MEDNNKVLLNSWSIKTTSFNPEEYTLPGYIPEWWWKYEKEGDILWLRKFSTIDFWTLNHALDITHYIQKRLFETLNNKKGSRTL